MKLQVVLFLTVCLRSSHSVTVRPVTCESGMYYDQVLGRCDFCDAICDFADIQGTLSECHTYCPDYATTTAMATTQTSPLSCDAERKTITTLLVALCGVSALLIGLMVFLVAMAFRRVHGKKVPKSRKFQMPAPRPLIVKKSQNQTWPGQYQKNNVCDIPGTKDQLVTT